MQTLIRPLRFINLIFTGALSFQRAIGEIERFRTILNQHEFASLHCVYLLPFSCLAYTLDQDLNFSVVHLDFHINSSQFCCPGHSGDGKYPD